MKAWLKRLDDLKAEALAKRAGRSSENTNNAEATVSAFREELGRGTPIGKAAANAEAKTGGPRYEAPLVKVRGWRFCMTLLETEKKGWCWQLSTSQVSSNANPQDLEAGVRHLGADYNTPVLTPAQTGGSVTHWHWQYDGKDQL